MNTEVLTLPKHIAVIMDGNGRWALRHGYDRTKGHEYGMWKLRDFMGYCSDFGIRIVTAYTLSTENWNRPRKEIVGLLSLIRKHAPEFVHELNDKNVKITHLGERDGIPRDILKIIDEAEELTKNNKEYFLNLAFNYGGRQEIARAAAKILAADVKAEDVTEELVSSYMYTGDFPDPDLVIRTGGESRISNFLLWQTANSVFYMTKTEWPDFDQSNFAEAIKTYSDYIHGIT